MIKRIHVNQHNIKHNAKNPEDPRPVFTVKTYKGNTKGFVAEFKEGGSLVYSPDCPLACGAKVWIETTGQVTVDGKAVV